MPTIIEAFPLDRFVQILVSPKINNAIFIMVMTSSDASARNAAGVTGFSKNARLVASGLFMSNALVSAISVTVSAIMHSRSTIENMFA